MITRRKFVQTSLAASAAALTGCRDEPKKTSEPPAAPPAAAAANAELRLMFVGGTVFRQDGDMIMAMQLSGKGQVYHGHSLEHASYIAGPDKYFFGPALPARLVASRSALGGFKTDCLIGKTVTVTGKKVGAKNKCDRLADYKGVADNWKPNGAWEPNDAINSVFRLMDGDLVDDTAINQTAAKVKWHIKDKNNKKELSDVAVLNLKAPEIIISGLTKDDIVVKPEFPLTLAVFAGPREFHKEGHKYTQITHALLLKTVYKVDVSDDELMPTTEHLVVGELGAPMDNPCPDNRPQRVIVPPDSEYCPNYGGTP